MKGLYKEEYFGFRNAEDYKNHLPMTPMTYIASEPVTNDTFAVSGNTVHAKPTTTRGYFMKYITGLLEGDVIEVECDVRNISGVKAKIGIDEAASLNLSGARANVLVKQSERSGEWETLKVRYVVKNKNAGYDIAHLVVIGTFFEEVSEYYIRKVRIKVLKQIASEPIERTQTVTSDSIITKWENGDMEIVSKKTFTDVSVTKAWGSIFSSDNLSLGSWEIPFVGTPTVSVIGVSDNSSTLMTAIATQPNATTFPIMVLVRGTVTASPIPTVTFHVIAKGRWK